MNAPFGTIALQASFRRLSFVTDHPGAALNTSPRRNNHQHMVVTQTIATKAVVQIGTIAAITCDLSYHLLRIGTMACHQSANALTSVFEFAARSPLQAIGGSVSYTVAEPFPILRPWLALRRCLAPASL